jgi:ABC-type amino acid transport substrate-binding protein
MQRSFFNTRLSRRRALATLAVLSCPAFAAQPLRILHQGRESADDLRYDYYWAVLGQALEQTRAGWGAFELSADGAMNGLRAVQQLETGKLQVLARPTSVEFEQRLRPIRIPLDKGMLGYRVFLIRRALQARLDQVRSIDDLRRFSIGQSSAWSDGAILEGAGFNVVRGRSYEGLFGMLAAGRFDLFSRSVTEASGELALRQSRYPELVVERGLLLYYPWPRYLFVRRDAAGEQLALRIEEGIERMRRDGSLELLFARYKAPVELGLNLKQRRLFRIANPLLPPATPLQRAELWYDPTL